MTHRKPVYIAAPYAAATPELRRCNVDRAVLFAQLAHREGFAPLCVHPLIEAGAYGRDGNVTDRILGMQSSLSLMAMVQRHTAGQLWVVQVAAGVDSPGVTDEIRAWKARRLGSSRGAVARRGPWHAWENYCRARGLHDRWTELAMVHTQLSIDAGALLGAAAP